MVDFDAVLLLERLNERGVAGRRPRAAGIGDSQRVLGEGFLEGQGGRGERREVLAEPTRTSRRLMA